MRSTIPSLIFLLFFLTVNYSYADDYSRFKSSSAKDPNNFKAGISFVWLSDYDSQGLMFSNKFGHYFGERFSVGLNVGLLTASRYDEGKKIFSIKNTFYMGALEAGFDVIRNEQVTLRLGVGGTARRRNEINSEPDDQGTVDGSVVHIKTSDTGVNGFLENDFSFLRSGIIGGRVDYFYYTSGTPVFGIGLHVGFRF
ncbi:hypothetical protein H7F15_13460 [Pontibacter sp. Tf4]|uniref:hypothetical protein n=1 Tax=Pontibacter sp. Tf4 TaxID=2761620 RepID=UPI00162574B0|nr:hypothetical protein [Pontibacter sp. Tf4]MBB6612052.1 hypothetical protein [Pontibacter sp. Tf4]